MKTTFLVRVAILLLITSALSGCLLVPVDEGVRGGGGGSHDRGEGGGHGGDRGGDRGGNHERH